MDWGRSLAVVALLVVAVGAGGAAVRLALAVGDLRAGTTIALVAVVLAVAVLAGAHGRRWRQNPYW